MERLQLVTAEGWALSTCSVLMILIAIACGLACARRKEMDGVHFLLCVVGICLFIASIPLGCEGVTRLMNAYIAPNALLKQEGFQVSTPVKWE
jgi:hypothetical protein